MRLRECRLFGQICHEPGLTAKRSRGVSRTRINGCTEENSRPGARSRPCLNNRTLRRRTSAPMGSWLPPNASKIFVNGGLKIARWIFLQKCLHINSCIFDNLADSVQTSLNSSAPANASVAASTEIAVMRSKIKHPYPKIACERCCATNG